MNGSLSEPERASLLDGLERTATEFDKIAREVPEAQWKPGPESGKWSPGQIAEHLVLVEQQLFAMLMDKLLTGPEVERSADQAELDLTIPAAVLNPERRPEAPPTMRPTGRWTDRDSVLAAFRSERQRTIEYVRETMDPLRTRRIARPGLGNMDGHHWLLLLVAHTERHTRQLHEVVAVAEHDVAQNTL